MESSFLIPLMNGAISALIGVSVFVWRFSGRFTMLEAKLDSIKNELTEFKQEVREDLKEVKSDINKLEERVGKLENNVSGMNIQINMLFVHPEILAKGMRELPPSPTK